MIDNILLELSNIIGNNIILTPFIVILAGVLTSLTPCSLSSIPLIVGYVNYITDTEENNKKKALKVSLIFAIGQAVTFTALGTAATLLGKLMKTTGSWWYILLGVLMTLMALQILEVYQFIKPINININVNKGSKGYIGAFFTGTVGGLFASPCATPVFVVLLGLISRSDNMVWGIFLMFLYSIGVNALVILSGVFTGFVNNMINSEKYKGFSVFLRYLMGIGVLLIAMYMFYSGF